MTIRHLKHNDIDIRKWDKCIRDAYNGVVFAFSWYLDIVADHWEALVVEDYDFVMPLPVKHIMSFDYIFQPQFVGHLGIFSKSMITTDIVDEFIEALPYPFIDLQLNIHNQFTLNETLKVKKKEVAKIDLISTYKSMKSSYSDAMRAGVACGIGSQYTVQNNLSPNIFIDFMQNRAALDKKLHQDDLQQLRLLAVNATRYRVGVVYGAYSARNSLEAVAFFMGSHNKICLLTVATSKVGEVDNVLPLLFDYYFEQQAELNISLELEPNYTSITNDWWTNVGAKNYTIDVLVQKNTPWYLKVLKI